MWDQLEFNSLIYMYIASFVWRSEQSLVPVCFLLLPLPKIVSVELNKSGTEREKHTQHTMKPSVIDRIGYVHA